MTGVDGLAGLEPLAAHPVRGGLRVLPRHWPTGAAVLIPGTARIRPPA